VEAIGEDSHTPVRGTLVMIDSKLMEGDEHPAYMAHFTLQTLKLYCCKGKVKVNGV